MWPLDARHVADWLAKYDHAKKSYTRGFISRVEAEDALRDLRYRDDALRIEMLEWQRAKNQRTSRQLQSARKKLEPFLTPTST